MWKCACIPVSRLLAPSIKKFPSTLEVCDALVRGIPPSHLSSLPLVFSFDCLQRRFAKPLHLSPLPAPCCWSLPSLTWLIIIQLRSYRQVCHLNAGCIDGGWSVDVDALLWRCLRPRMTLSDAGGDGHDRPAPRAHREARILGQN